MDQTKEQKLQEIVSDGYAAAKTVLENWESGNLAAAVNELEAWAETAKPFAPASMETIGNQHGFLCPECLSGQDLEIYAIHPVRLRPDGTEDEGGDTEWQDDSRVDCNACQAWRFSRPSGRERQMVQT